jgi:hypothetical protein
MFDRPAPAGDQFQNATNVGNLLAIEVLAPERAVPTKNGPADAIRANVYVIDPAGTVAAEYVNTLMFGKVLFSRLSQSVGRTVLGVFTGQPGVSRDGKSVAYDLADPTDAMEAAAVRAMTSRPAQSAPAGDPWAQQPAAAAPAPWGQPVAPAGPPPGWGGPQTGPASAGSWTNPPAPSQEPWGAGQPAAAPPAPQAPPAAPPWAAQAPAQQPLPEPSADVPPWEQQPAAPPWGQQ